MNQSYLNVFPHSAAENRQFVFEFGCAVALLAAGKDYPGYSATRLTLLEEALKHRQLRLTFDPDSLPESYVAWAFLSREVEQRVLKNSAFQLHPSEWDEGECLWIVDLVAPEGRVASVLSELAGVLGVSRSDMAWLRPRDGSARRNGRPWSAACFDAQASGHP